MEKANNHFDLHLHLNGSISSAFLKKQALRNHKENIFESYLYSLSNSTDPWEKFHLIHELMRNADLSEAVLDVVAQAEANEVGYLEIRTSVKGESSKERGLYLESFLLGLEKANKLYPKVLAKGLLSADRSRCSLSLARELLNFLSQNNENLVGLDIAGNFNGPENKRALYGEDLNTLLREATQASIPLAIHLAERAHDSDTQVVLDFFSSFPDLVPVRFGHCAYLTSSQLKLIKKLDIPVEICPSMHLLLAWWKKDVKGEMLDHPCRNLNNVVMGTDDSALTTKNHKIDRAIFCKHWQITEEELSERSRKVCFSPFSP